ncbi:MAG: hypothetical protein JO356_18935, partial [Acidobacteria bacterium]|nr:hypothetical protein [Acidobacteriota bacterium]
MRSDFASAALSLGRSVSCHWLFATVFLLGYPAHALDPHKTLAQYVHEVWSTKNGLPEADVMAILQTRDGYLWVGTEEGLARFDGTHFVVFDRNTASLANNRVQALAETSDGSLWIGTENGLSRLQGHQFTSYGTADGLPSGNIRALSADPKGGLWVTTVGGVRVWHGAAFEQVPSIEAGTQNSARQVLPMANGKIWMAGESSVSVSDLGDKILTGNWTLGGSLVRTMMMDDEGEVLWIGTNSGLYHLREGRVSPFRLGSSRARPEVTALLEDRHHNLWVGTLGDGLIRVNREGELGFSVGDGLSGVEVKSLFEDSAGNLWVGTFGGLEVFRDSMFTPYGKPEGLSEKVVWTVMESRDSAIWMGTQGGGLNRLKDGKITAYSTREGFVDNTVGALFEGSDGTLWLGKDSGLGIFKRGKVFRVPLANTSLEEQVHAIFEDKAGHLWVGTRASGLIELRRGQRRRLSTQEGLVDNNIQTIIPSKRGGMWIGTLGGLSYYQDDHLTNYTTANGLSADQVISLYEDAQATLWIGTSGLNRLKDGKVTVYGDSDGLFNEDVLSIVEDDNNYLWLATNKGIVRLSKQQLNDRAAGKIQTLTPEIFGSTDGMRSAECNGGSSPAAWKDHAGNLWFSTVAGALKLDPRW